MAYISFQPSDYFNPVGYTGTASGAKVVTGVGFQPDNIFFKLRSGVYSWAAIDAVRGVTKILECDADGAEGTNLNYLASFDSDGFTTTATQDTGTNSSGTYMGFSWKAGTTSGLTGGTITPSAYSFNATSGFGMYKFTGKAIGGSDYAGPITAVANKMLVFLKNSVCPTCMCRHV